MTENPDPLVPTPKHLADYVYVTEQLMTRKNAQIRDLREELERTKAALTISEASARYWQYQAETELKPDDEFGDFGHEERMDDE